MVYTRVTLYRCERKTDRHDLKKETNKPTEKKDGDSWIEKHSDCQRKTDKQRWIDKESDTQTGRTDTLCT